MLNFVYFYKYFSLFQSCTSQHYLGQRKWKQNRDSKCFLLFSNSNSLPLCIGGKHRSHNTWEWGPWHQHWEAKNWGVLKSQFIICVGTWLCLCFPIYTITMQIQFSWGTFKSSLIFGGTIHKEPGKSRFALCSRCLSPHSGNYHWLPGHITCQNKRAEQTIVRGSGFATSSKIPLRHHSYMLPLTAAKEKKIMHCVRYLYITAQKYPAGRAGEKRREKATT